MNTASGPCGSGNDQNIGETEAGFGSPRPAISDHATPSAQDPTTEAQEHAARMAAGTARLQQRIEKRKQMEADQAAREEHAKRMAALTQRLVAAEKRRADHEALMQNVEAEFLEATKRREKVDSEIAAREAHTDMMDGVERELREAEKRRHDVEKRRQEVEEKYPGIDTSGPLDLNKKRNRLPEEWDDEE